MTANGTSNSATANTGVTISSNNLTALSVKASNGSLRSKNTAFGGILELESGTTTDVWQTYNYSPDGTYRCNYNGSGGDELILTTGGVLTASGGVKFNPSTGTLNYYEEGSWTPSVTIGGSTAGVTYQIRFGRYIRIGSSVTIWSCIRLTSTGGLSGEVTITGLPFTPANIGSYQHPVGSTVIVESSSTDIFASALNSTAIFFRQQNATGDVAMTAANKVDNDTAILVTCTYQT